MKILRFQYKEKIQFGWLKGDEIGLIEGDIFSEYRRLETELLLERVKVLTPVSPGKIICVARNYEEHAREHKVEIPEYPMIFLKPPSALIGNGEAIRIPPQSKQVEHEAELAVIIKKQGKWIDPAEVSSHILGYTIANDVSARDLQYRDGQWTRAKGFDTFCPLGPWVETELDPSDLMISCRVNGELRQMSSTKEMIFPINQLVSYISSIMTLEPGDVILTGTPAGVEKLEAGDLVEISIEGIGVLSNPVMDS
jgi:2-keto-4-pentenoate hydratase/2-oxohepta-3-ene-1,7-dioic acid hydratase in catechol pathway